ncbi:M14 family zinc carboxypeptidase [Shewanella sp. Isolate11]|uniref:M14 family zinc carboxypeptidase n=1 Tax=Shewanella sp. Isolate11 TaxID=2908530 RepID=UPI001EFDB152|nr:M14 family zinc carboxypeptidase [Shewanella sp. Isolate11]MCG9698052.1 peptidase M14 [Shewanella sp. Isolate11]
MLRLCILLLSFFSFYSSFASNAQSLSSTPIDALSAIESPQQFLGYPLGEWHLRHDQINYYLKQLASQSPRVSLESTGYSHERRQQLTAVITSKQNQDRLDSILAERAQVKTGTKQTGPLIIWLAYSIHGDEASGAHAALQVSYELSISQDPWVKELLDNAVVLITPTQNPDGFDRFSTWTNNYTGKIKVSDPKHNEHKQNWPAGRVNHYFADLNRDWLFLRHPESQGRIALFHKWNPHYVGDFHEMGHNKTYFFQPGVPNRTHPLTPSENQEITNKLAQFHAKALDNLKQPYYTKQGFDDFYYGKGSTYPDINGSVGVLFEQASVRGQIQDSDNGLITFQQAINNQIATSYSSLEGAFALRQELQNYQARFYQRKDKHQPSGREIGFLVSTSDDPGRRDDLAQLLAQHQIQYFYLPDTIKQGQHRYQPQDSLFIPINQKQKSLLLAMFDPRTEFENPTFYDVSSWNLGYSYNLDMIRDASLNVDNLLTTHPDYVTTNIDKDSVAVLIDWRQQNAAAMLQQLLSSGVRVKFAASAFSIETKQQVTQFAAGTLQIPLGEQELEFNQLNELIQTLAKQYQVAFTPLNTGLSITGIDLGSTDFYKINPIKPLVLTGYGSVASEVGELWYYMDNRIGAPLTQVDMSRVGELNFDPYSHLFLVDGNYRNLDNKDARRISQFVKDGGIIVAQKGALEWLSKNNLLRTDVKGSRFYSQLFSSDGMSFADKDTLKARRAIGGAVVALNLDASHPLNFGIVGEQLPILKNKALGLVQSDTPFITAASYADEPLLDGYLAEEYQRSLSDTPAMVVERRGKGAVVALSDDLLFRNIWLGSEKVYSNSLYFIPNLH